MNRWDEIKCAALEVAHHVTPDPDARNAMADDLITLVGLMLGAVGKCIATEGESDMGDARNAELPWGDGPEPDPEAVAEAMSERAEDMVNAYTRYLTGEALLREADHVATQAHSADLERWTTHGTQGGWHPRCRECGKREGHKLDCGQRPIIEPRCNCCGGKCQHGLPQAGPEKCCYPLGDVCPIHC